MLTLNLHSSVKQIKVMKLFLIKLKLITPKSLTNDFNFNSIRFNYFFVCYVNFMNDFVII
jgi:hypothetical protein